jgi:hypothetical protein
MWDGRLPLEPALVVLAGLAALLAVSCRCGSEQAPPPPADASVAVPTCRRSGVQLTLAGSAAIQKVDPEQDPSVELPFAPEAGVGLSVGDQLFATGLRREGRATSAMLARFGPEADSLDLVELARLQGDASPPRLASDGRHLIVGVQETTPSGYELRVARLEPTQLHAGFSWHSAPPQAKDDSNVFDLAASNERIVVVWDEWHADTRRGRVSSSVFKAGPASPAQPLSDPDVDAERPRISVRPAGYWVAWLVNLDAGAGRVDEPEHGDRPARDGASDARGIELVALDAEGRRSGAAMRVTGPDDRVVGYDLTTSPTGAAWLVWRHDVFSSGASGGRVSMAEAQAEGGMEIALLEDRAVGAGEPSWLPAGDDSGPWLTFPDDADRTLLFRVQRPMSLSEPLALKGDSSRAAALGAAKDRILFAAPRGGDVELFPAWCDAPAARASVSSQLAPVLPAALADASPPPQ